MRLWVPLLRPGLSCGAELRGDMSASHTQRDPQIQPTEVFDSERFVACNLSFSKDGRALCTGSPFAVLSKHGRHIVVVGFVRRELESALCGGSHIWA
jgi:hypothetical protein